jgi:hypothetical protein
VLRLTSSPPANSSLVQHLSSGAVPKALQLLPPPLVLGLLLT